MGTVRKLSADRLTVKQALTFGMDYPAKCADRESYASTGDRRTKANAQFLPRISLRLLSVLAPLRFTAGGSSSRMSKFAVIFALATLCVTSAGVSAADHAEVPTARIDKGFTQSIPDSDVSFEMM